MSVVTVQFASVALGMLFGEGRQLPPTRIDQGLPPDFELIEAEVTDQGDLVLKIRTDELPDQERPIVMSTLTGDNG